MSGVATAIAAAAAVVGAGVAAYSASESSKAAASSAKKQAAATAAAAGIMAGASEKGTELQLQYLREVRADIAAAVEAGQLDLNTAFALATGQLEPMAGLEEYNAARGLLADPSSLMNRPSNIFQYNQGIEAMQSAFSRTSGGGVSGPSMQAAIQYGQNFASTALDAELNRLFPFINTAIQARTNLANVAQNWGTAAANLGVGGAGGIANVTGQIIPSVAQGITGTGQNIAALTQQGGQIAATNAVQQANIQTGLYSNIADMGTNMAMLYASNPGMFK